jgi:hypothetical protein
VVSWMYLQGLFLQLQAILNQWFIAQMVDNFYFGINIKKKKINSIFSC